MRVLVLPALLLLLAGCGAYNFPGSPSSAPGAVAGRVTAYPCAPVEQPANVCAGRPVAGVELDYTGPGCGPCKTVSDSTGAYSISLGAGTYNVRLATYMRVISGALTVDVASGQTLTLNYLVDSGIRAPVPEQSPPALP